jgi:hypothetical protein
VARSSCCFIQRNILTETLASAGAFSNDNENRPPGVEIDSELGITLSTNADDTDDVGNPIFSTQLAVRAFAYYGNEIDTDGLL